MSTAQITIVAFYSTLLMYIFARRAGANVPVQYLEIARTLGASRWTRFRNVYLPGSVPELIGGFRIVLAGAWGLEAVAELMGAQQGVGFLIRFHSNSFNIRGMLALAVMLGIAAVFVDRAVVLISRYLVRWTETGKALAL